MSAIKHELFSKLIQKALWILFSVIDREFGHKLVLLLQLYLSFDMKKNK